MKKFICTPFNICLSALSGKQSSIKASLLAAFLCLASIATAKSTEEIYKENKGAIVLLLAYDRNGNAFSQGSGFFISPNRIATNYHVVEGGSQLKYKTLRQEKLKSVHQVLAYSKSLDLAILSVDNNDKDLTVRRDLFNRIGAKVIAIGNPKGLTGTVSEGIISGIRRLNSIPFLQITAPISPGSSGGPLFNQTGDVIGVTTLIIASKHSQNLNFAVPSYLLLELAQRGGNWEPVKIPEAAPSQTGSSVSTPGNGPKESYTGNNRFGSPWAGVFVVRYPSGQKKEELNYREGKKEGVCTYWHSNGKKSKQTQWKNGKPDGLWLTWDDSGRVTDRVVYRNGVAFR